MGGYLGLHRYCVVAEMGGYLDLHLYCVVAEIGGYLDLHLYCVVAEMGGYLGLHLGASLLTLTEMVEFLIFLMLSFCQRSRITAVQAMKTDISDSKL